MDGDSILESPLEIFIPTAEDIEEFCQGERIVRQEGDLVGVAKDEIQIFEESGLGKAMDLQNIVSERILGTKGNEGIFPGRRLDLVKLDFLESTFSGCRLL